MFARRKNVSLYRHEIGWCCARLCALRVRLRRLLKVHVVVYRSKALPNCTLYFKPRLSTYFLTRVIENWNISNGIISFNLIKFKYSLRVVLEMAKSYVPRSRFFDITRYLPRGVWHSYIHFGGPLVGGAFPVKPRPSHPRWSRFCIPIEWVIAQVGGVYRNISNGTILLNLIKFKYSSNPTYAAVDFRLRKR